MRKILVFVFSFTFFSISIAQTTYFWRSEATNGSWTQSGNWWDGSSSSNVPGGSEIIKFDNTSQTSMTNDLLATNRFQIIFEATTISRSISGIVENTFYDFGGTNPKIENNSTLGMLINFPIKLGYNPLEINPVNGPFSILGAINTNGNYIDVYGNGGDSLAFGGGISGSGGLTIKENSRVIYAGTAITYFGNTTVEAGQLDIRTSMANSHIAIKNGGSAIVYGTGITVKSITVEPGGELTVFGNGGLTITGDLSNSGTVSVEAGGQLTVSGNLTNNNSFTLKSDGTGKPVVGNPTGSLIVEGTIIGNISTQRYISGHNDVADAGWHYISSPIDNFVVSGSDFDPTGTSDLYSWDEVNYTWKNYEANSFDLVKEKGYLCAYTSDATKTFTGNPNNSAVSISGLTLTENSADSTENGWNLIGNPYTSAIAWDIGSWTHSNIAATAKVWPGTGNWVDITSGGDNIIPAMNGFMVQVSGGATGSLTIPTSARTHDATTWYKNNQETVAFKIYGGSNAFSDLVRVNFNELATDDYDAEFDSHKLYGLETAPQLFTRIGQHKFSTNTLADSQAQRELDMDFIPGTSGEYTIEVIENTVPASSIYLKDLVTGQMIDISEKTTYSFNAEVGDAEDRFKLVFGATGINEIQKESLQAYVSGDQLYILGEEGQATLTVYDIQGKQLFNEQVELNSQFRQSLDLPQGIYVVSVQGNQVVKTAKVIIK